MSREIAFVGFGLEYLAMAVHAARGLRENSPGIQTLCITNLPVQALLENHPFDRVVYEDRPDSENRLAKVRAFEHMEADAGGLLDTDLEIVADLNPVFRMLDRFDVLLHAARYPTKYEFLIDRDLPSVFFPQFYGGFLFFRRNEAVRRFFASWEERLVESAIRRDQPALQRAVWDNPDLKTLALNTVWGATDEEAERHILLGREPMRIVHYGDVGSDARILHEVGRIVDALHAGLSDDQRRRPEVQDTVRRFRHLRNPLLHRVLTTPSLEGAWKRFGPFLPSRLSSSRRKRDRAMGADHLGGATLWKDV